MLFLTEPRGSAKQITEENLVWGLFYTIFSVTKPTKFYSIWKFLYCDMRRFSRWPLFFFCKDGNDWSMRRDCCCCCSFLCVVLATVVSLVLLVVLATVFAWHHCFIVTQTQTDGQTDRHTHTHAEALRLLRLTWSVAGVAWCACHSLDTFFSLWHTHTHTHTHSTHHSLSRVVQNAPLTLIVFISSLRKRRSGSTKSLTVVAIMSRWAEPSCCSAWPHFNKALPEHKQKPHSVEVTRPKTAQKDWKEVWKDDKEQKKRKGKGKENRKGKVQVLKRGKHILISTKAGHLSPWQSN